MMNRQRAFTMVEMAIVIIIIGILTASIAPLLLRQHTGTMEERDRVALEDAKTAIINYAISFGGIPDPDAGAMRVIPAFGVNNWGAFGAAANPFRLDVNDKLKSSAINFIATSSVSNAPEGGDRVVFCQAVNEQMLTATAAFVPAACQDYANDHVAAACATSVPVAFVLYSTGNDRKPNQENNENDPASPPVAAMLNNRIYENDKRGINNSSEGTLHYDDQVMSYPLSALVRDCREKMHVASEVMNCPAGQEYVGSITNNSATQVFYYFNSDLAASAPVPASNYTVHINLCHARTDTLTIAPGLAAAQLRSALDANADGRVDVFIDAAGDVRGQ